MKQYKKLFQSLFFALSFVVVTTAYQNCGGGSSNGGGGGASTAETGNGDIEAIPNTKTASIIRSGRTLDNLVSCLGVQQASRGDGSSRSVYSANSGTISEEGLANSMTQPMGKALISIAAEVCEDLYDRENDQNNQKHIWLEVDYNADSVSQTDLTNGVKRIARSCWGRNATSDELSMILDDVSSTFAGSPDNQQTVKNKMIYICAAMASSFAAYEM